MSRPRPPRRRLTVAAATLAVATAGAMATYEMLWRQGPAAVHTSDETHFLFGSIGTETGGHGLPYWLWLVLPRVFPDLLPGAEGYWSLGVTGFPGAEMPVGFSKVRVGVDRVGPTCAACHTARYRLRPDDPVTIVPGAPGHQTGFEQYRRFLASAANDPRFTASTLLGEVAKNTRLGLLERLAYRFVIVPVTRRTLRAQNPLQEERHGPSWGRGRADLLALLHGPRHDSHGSAGAADAMPLWGVSNDDHPRFWDGSSRTLRDAVALSALSTGAAPAWIARDLARWNDTDPTDPSSLRRVADFMAAVRPPRFPRAVDAVLASSGAAVFSGSCARCHAPGHAQADAVIPLAEIGTDRHRADAWQADRLARLGDEVRAQEGPRSVGLRATGGYRAVRLDGLWLRAPYLHNGSVPTLADLLAPPDERPRAFWRGYDLFDADRIGFVSSGTEAARVGTWFDTGEPGNGNGGHTYGTDLSSQQKRALLEYLKTL